MPEEPIHAAELYVADSPLHATGVFAGRDFAADEVIETAPVIVFPADQLEHVDQTSLHGYYFAWADDGGGLALGFGSLYNHSFAPNARYETDWDGGVVVFSALVDIAADEEILINYNGDPESQEALWFDVYELEE